MLAELKSHMAESPSVSQSMDFSAETYTSLGFGEHDQTGITVMDNVTHVQEFACGGRIKA